MLDSGLVDWLQESLAPLGPVRIRRMFGGAGVSLDGLTFALILADRLWLRVDPVTEPAFLAEDLPPFTYQRAGRTVALGYRAAPDVVLDDPEAMQHWAGQALAAAGRVAMAKVGKARQPGKARTLK